MISFTDPLTDVIPATIPPGASKSVTITGPIGVTEVLKCNVINEAGATLVALADGVLLTSEKLVCVYPPITSEYKQMKIKNKRNK
jgi:hypothetical protein